MRLELSRSWFQEAAADFGEQQELGHGALAAPSVRSGPCGRRTSGLAAPGAREQSQSREQEVESRGEEELEQTAAAQIGSWGGSFFFSFFLPSQGSVICTNCPSVPAWERPHKGNLEPSPLFM